MRAGDCSRVLQCGAEGALLQLESAAKGAALTVSIREEDKVKSNYQSDVVVIGSGIIGSAAALLLVRQGLSVTILDNSEHPKFAIGESTLAPTSFWMTLLAERWSVPELGTIAVASRINNSVAASCGVKRNFGFIYHEPGAGDHSQAWHAPIPGGPEDQNGESHLYRQDVDAWLYHAALAAGAKGFSKTSLTHASSNADFVHLTAADGQVFRARFVVDASGFNSVLSREFGLRSQPTWLRTRSRSLFTHMIGVRPYDALEGVSSPTTPWHQGTLHHVFKGGWAWVIPFDNHPASRNRLCSVGLNLRVDNPADAAPLADPEGVWKAWLKDHPSVARQFEHAVPVRPWVATGRLQYANETCIGHRFWITPAAAGAVDALYSRGLLIAFQGMATAVRSIIGAFADGDFALERFAPIDAQWRNMLAFHDHLVHGSYASFVDTELFELWLTIWLLSELVYVEHVLPALSSYATSGDRAALDFDAADPSAWIAHHRIVGPLMERWSAAMQRFEQGEVDRAATLTELERGCALVKRISGFDHKFRGKDLRNLTKPAPRLDRSAARAGLTRMGLANFG